MARSYIIQAKIRISAIERAIPEGNYAYAIRQSQEAVELCLKASLRLVAIEPPRWHDVGPILRAYRSRFPQWFQENIDRYAYISRQLRREREPSMYGDEELGIPPDELYTRYDAEQIYYYAKEILDACLRLYRELVGEEIDP